MYKRQQLDEYKRYVNHLRERVEGDDEVIHLDDLDPDVGGDEPAFMSDRDPDRDEPSFRIG